MARKRLLWQIFPSYSVITLVAIAAVSWYASRSFRASFLDEVAADLEARCRLAECEIAPLLAAGRLAEIAEACRTLGSLSDTRLTVILPDGTVIGDSQEEPGRMDNHADRPEVRDALAGRRGTSNRYSRTARQDTMYAAMPLLSEGKIAAVVRAAVPVAYIQATLHAISVRIALGGLAAAAVAAAFSLVLSRRISRTLEVMRAGAERFSRGDLEHRLEVPGSLEIGGLAEAMNQMASRLDERIRTILKQRNEQQAVLASMVEGVLAVDLEERAINMNAAAARLLEVDASGLKGRTLQEIVRSTDLQGFVSRALAAEEPIEGEFPLGPDRDKLVQVRGTALRDDRDRRIGALIVLHDITRLTKLENVRREFVANVSHELKTPITSIKAAVETLLDGALGDGEDARRFLEITGRHADRLNAIVDDLLQLSRIEQEAEKKEIPLAPGQVRAVLEAAIRACSTPAAERNIRIELRCDQSVHARVNAPLLEEAVVNLVSNAIKYSEAGRSVVVQAGETGAGVAISVRDQGCGIAEEHLPRIFERFYRVDRARSRKMGGTGLGLAIAKHITQAHGGTISVRSRVGEGSTFTILLPPAE